jgi:hypothetical protein
MRFRAAADVALIVSAQLTEKTYGCRRWLLQLRPERISSGLGVAGMKTNNPSTVTKTGKSPIKAAKSLDKNPTTLKKPTKLLPVKPL